MLKCNQPAAGAAGGPRRRLKFFRNLSNFRNDFTARPVPESSLFSVCSAFIAVQLSVTSLMRCCFSSSSTSSSTDSSASNAFRSPSVADSGLRSQQWTRDDATLLRPGATVRCTTPFSNIMRCPLRDGGAGCRRVERMIDQAHGIGRHCERQG